MGPTNSIENIMPLTNSIDAGCSSGSPVKPIAESCRDLSIAESTRNQPLCDPLDSSENDETIKTIALKGQSDKKGCYLPFALKTETGIWWTYALIDSGSSINVIHPRFTSQASLPLQQADHPMIALNADGSENRGGPATLQAKAIWKFQNTEWKPDVFRIVDIGNINVILGYGWLKKYNPPIDWKDTIVFFDELDVIKTVQNEQCNYLWECNSESLGEEEPSEIHYIRNQSYYYTNDDVPDIAEVAPLVPNQYHQWLPVFSKRVSECLPE